MKKVQTRDELLAVLKSCKAGLAERFGVTDLAVFGSYAREQQKKRSDIVPRLFLHPAGERTYDRSIRNFIADRST